MEAKTFSPLRRRRRKRLPGRKGKAKLLSERGEEGGGEEHGREEFDELFENKNEIGEELKGENCERQNNKKIWQIPY